VADHYASGNWHVKKGKEDEFVERWTEFLQWTRKDHTGLQHAQLIQDNDDKSHFVSTSEWDSVEARVAWKQSPEFAKMFGAAKALCDDMSSIDAERRVTI
jgi:heme-degrading monooxygenase HmoA